MLHQWYTLDPTDSNSATSKCVRTTYFSLRSTFWSACFTNGTPWTQQIPTVQPQNVSELPTSASGVPSGQHASPMVHPGPNRFQQCNLKMCQNYLLQPQEYLLVSMLHQWYTLDPTDSNSATSKCVRTTYF